MANTNYFYQRNHHGDLVILGIPFEFNGETKRYSINYNQVRYSLTEEMAISFHEWHVADSESGKCSYPLVEKWYNQLTDEQKDQVIKTYL